MNFYLVSGEGAEHIIRNEFTLGAEVRRVGTNTYVIGVEDDRMPWTVNGCRATKLDDCAWDSLPVWTPKDDAAYYNGLLYGHFGSIWSVDGHVLTIVTDLLTIRTNQAIWSMQGSNWFCDMRTVLSVKEHN